MLFKKKNKKENPKGFKDICPNYPIKSSLKIKQTKHHSQRWITRDLNWECMMLAWMVMITDKIELASVWGLTVKEENGKKKKKKKKKTLPCEVFKYRLLWKGYKNKTQEMEELFSVCSGKVYPNDKLSRGDGPTTFESLFP